MDIKGHISFQVIEHLTPKEKTRRKRAAKAKRILGYLAAFFLIFAIVLSYYAFQRLNALVGVMSGGVMFLSILLYNARCIAHSIYEHPNLKDDGIE